MNMDEVRDQRIMINMKTCIIYWILVNSLNLLKCLSLIFIYNGAIALIYMFAPKSCG
jgi:hypothetical protein